jgi:hypothetical protein
MIMYRVCEFPDEGLSEPQEDSEAAADFDGA